MENLYYSLIHSYLNFANIAWGSTHQSKLNCLHIRQKQACRIITRKSKYTPSQGLFKSLRILNVYQLNLYHHLIFMYKSKMNLVPSIFINRFTSISHKYPTDYCQGSFRLQNCKNKIASLLNFLPCT